MNRLMELVKREKKTMLWVLMGIYGGCSVSYLFNLMAGDTTDISFSVLMTPIFVGILFFEKIYVAELAKLEGKLLRRRVIYTAILGMLLGLSFVLGYQMQVLGLTSTGVKGKLFILFVSAGIGVALMPILNYWFALLESEPGKLKKPAKPAWKSSKCFWVSWAVIFAAWIPAFLAYYPAIMSYDFHRQSQEAVMGTGWLNTHHPLAHTLLIRFFFGVGEKLGSYEVGMAIFSILQMLILSVVMAYSCAMIGRLTKKRWPVVVAVINFAILPIHPVLALSMTKDILFTALFLLVLLLLLEYNQATCAKVKWLLFAAMIVVGSVSMLYRNNAIYAFAAFAVFYVLWSKKERLVILLLCVLMLVGGKGLGLGIKAAVQGNPGSGIEMFSVFVMQFARVGVTQGENLSDEDFVFIDYFVDDVNWQYYTPAIADGVKNNVHNSSYVNWKDNVPAMLQYWVKIGLKYPNEYIDAFLALTSGYWFLDDVSHAEVLGYGEDTNLGLLYTFNASKSDVFEGVESHSYLPGLLKIYQKIVNGNEYYDWPVVSNLFKPAFYAWTLLVTMMSLLYMKQGRKLILCLLPFFYLCTLILGPVVNFRYIYPVVVTIPVLLAWMFSDWEWKSKVEKVGAVESSDEVVEEVVEKVAEE